MSAKRKVHKKDNPEAMLKRIVSIAEILAKVESVSSEETHD